MNNHSCLMRTSFGFRYTRPDKDLLKASDLYAQ